MGPIGVQSAEMRSKWGVYISNLNFGLGWIFFYFGTWTLGVLVACKQCMPGNRL